MSGGQTALTCGLAPGLHVCECVYVRVRVCVCVCVCVLKFPLGLTLMPLSENVLMTQTALALCLTPHLSVFTFTHSFGSEHSLKLCVCGHVI